MVSHTEKIFDDVGAKTHDELTGVTSDQHHNETHTIVSHDTTATGTELTELTDGSTTILHAHAGGSDDLDDVCDRGAVTNQIIETGGLTTDGDIEAENTDLTGDVILTNTTFANYKGRIMKGTLPFLWDWSYGDNGTVTPDGNNLFLGKYAGTTTCGATAAAAYQGSYNLAVGLFAGSSLSTGYRNMALGFQSLLRCNTGRYNVGIGSGAGYNITSGSQNMCIGASSLGLCTTNYYNCAIGYGALYATTGAGNVGIGDSAFSQNTTGSYGIGIGYNAGTKITGGVSNNATGNNSIFIGRNTRAKANGETNQIVIGDQTTGNGSNTCTIGNSSITHTYLNGLVTPTKTPSSASDTGTAGEFAWDSSYIYICTATNTWKRVAIASW